MEHRRSASTHTRAANEAVRASLPFEDRIDFDDAMRGFIAPLPDEGTVMRADGWPAWMPSRFNFVNEGDAPDTVNPSLWRQSQLCMIGGLFQVTDRLYQVRNVDLSNLTIVEGDTGIIVFDPLITTEAAAAALEVYYAHRPRKPVVAVLYSHSHIDHYGGVKGIVSEQDVESGRVQIIAPVGFLEAAVAENVFAGNVMTRRAMYMYGMLLPADPRGNVGCGLGMATSGGTTTLIPPTVEITETGQKMVIDGLTFEFMLAPDSEAPAEMHWFIEELAAVTAAENCCHTMHNTYTLRGAPIRDPHGWSRYLDETIERWGARAAVMYGMHHWPVWGSERVIDTLRKGRDGYRFINDETLRLANHGHGPVEIAEMVRLPEGLEHHWAMRGYYGTMNHNVKATYVKYLGFFDGNPAHLHELPPAESAARYVELMGGAAAVLERATDAYEAGEYRWVAELVNKVVFADPSNTAARELQAATLEQMGYQAESGPWRNFFLTGAQELRNGTPDLAGGRGGSASPDTVRAMTTGQFFDYLAVRLNGAAAGVLALTFEFVFTDTGERFAVELSNGSLHHRAVGARPSGTRAPDAPATDAQVRLTRENLNRFFLGEVDLLELVGSGEVVVTPDPAPLVTLVGLLDSFSPWFAIIEP